MFRKNVLPPSSASSFPRVPSDMLGFADGRGKPFGNFGKYLSVQTQKTQYLHLLYYQAVGV